MRRLLFASLSIMILAASPRPASGAQARSLPPDVLASRIASSPRHEETRRPAFESQTLSFQTAGGQLLSARLLVPEAPRESHERWPVLLVFGGFEEAGKVLDLLKPAVPVILASFDYPFSPPRKFEFPSSLRFAPDARKAVHETISGIAELYAALRLRKDVDAQRITVVGASFGAPFALAAAANDPDIHGVVLVHGFGDVPATVEKQITRKWQPRFGIFARPAAWLLARLGWWYLKAPEPEHAARLLTSSQRVLMISAQEDSFIPAEASGALWNALESSQAQHERVIMPGDHLQPGADKLISEISKIVTSWMEKVALR